MGVNKFSEQIELAKELNPEVENIEFRETFGYLVGDEGTVISHKFGKIRKLSRSIDTRNGRSMSGGRLLSWWIGHAFHRESYFEGAEAHHVRNRIFRIELH